MKRQIFVALATLVVWMPVITTSAQSVSARSLVQPSISSSSTSASPFALTSQQSGEITSLRTRTSRTYARDGHYVAQISATSINYKDGNGQWQPIDDSLVPSSASGYAYQNKANRYTVRFPADIGTSPVHVETSNGWVEFAPTGATGAGTVSGDTATYTLPGASLAFAANSDAVKETVTLQSAFSPSTYVYTLRTSAGLTPQQNSTGGIDFVNSSGTVQFSFAPPFMQDHAGAASHAVTLTLGGTGAATTVTLAADQTWLADPARSYPVVIDPTVTVGAPTQTACISNMSPSGCQTSRLVVAADPTHGTATRSLVQFNVSSIPSKMQILDADFNMELQSATSTFVVPINIYPLTQAWTSTGDSSTSASWTTYDGLDAWATPGGDFSSTPTVEADLSNSNNMQTIHWNIEQLMQGWTSGAVPNDGMILKEQSETTADTLTFLPTTISLTVTYAPLVGEQNFTVTEGTNLTEHMSYAVNPTTGDLMIHESDINMPGIGLPLTVDRTFNSQATNTGDFGNKWLMDSGQDVGLQYFTDGSYAFDGPTGFQVPFLGAGGTGTAPPGLDADLTHNRTTGYDTITFHTSGMQYNFSGYLVSIQDRSGNALTFNYTNGTMTSITDTQGRTTTFTYTGNQISQITDPAGRTYKYGYDTAGDMTTYTDPNNKVVTFTYASPGGALTQITDAKNNVTTFAYDSQNRITSVTRVSSACPNNGCTTSYSYGSSTSTTSTDANAHAASYNYDSYGRVTMFSTPLGHQWYWQWNSDNHYVTRTTPMSENTSDSYDSNNNLTQETAPSGASWSALYNNTATPYNPSSSTDAQGNKSTFTYDSAGRLLTTTDALNHKTSVTYNSNGTVATSTDANNHITTYTYFTATNNVCPTAETSQNVGLLCKVQSPLGITSYTYNSYNLVATKTDPKGQTTSYTYGPLGHMASETLADGMTSTFSRDANGNQVKEVDSQQLLGNTGLEDITSWQSSSATSDPVLGNTAHPNTGSKDALLCGVNSCNDQLWQTVTLPSPFTKLYLSFWVWITTQEASGAGQNDTMTAQIQTSTGTPITTALTLGNTNATSGYVLEKVDVSSALASYAGQQVRVAFTGTTNSTASTSFYLDDAALYATGTQTTTYAYDALNRLTEKWLPDGSTNSYTYDAVGNLTSKTDVFNGTSYTVSYAYDADNQLTSLTDPSNQVTNFIYDNDGRRTQIQFPGGTLESMGYNSSGQLTSIGAARYGTTFTSFSYSYYNWDKYLYQGLRYSMTDTSGTTSHYCYDAANQLTTVYTTSSTVKCSAPTVTPSHTYAYDPVGNMTSKAINGGTPTTMSYNAADELTSVGSTAYHYDANGNETSNGSLSFAYNAADQTTSMTPSTGSSSGMTYQGEGQTDRLTNGSNSYNYDDSGLVLSSDGTAATYVARTPDGQLVSEQVGGTSYYYLVDGLGSVIKLVNSTGVVEDSYSYDPYGGMTVLQQAVSNPFRYIGAVYDSTTGLYKMGARYYASDLGRFTQEDPTICGTSNRYSYSSDDPISDSDPSGLFSMDQFAKCMHANGVDGGTLTACISCATGITHLKSNPPPYILQDCRACLWDAGRPFGKCFAEAMFARSGATDTGLLDWWNEILTQVAELGKDTGDDGSGGGGGGEEEHWW